jgi:hypothetical protein
VVGITRAEEYRGLEGLDKCSILKKYGVRRIEIVIRRSCSRD